MLRSSRPRPRRQRGLALVSVLWWIVIVAAIAAVFMRETRVELDLARNGAAAARAEALADAGLHLAAQALLGIDHPVVADLGKDGAAEIALAGGRVRLTLEDEGGKIDLNRGPLAVLRRLFEIVGVAPDAAGRLAAAVADYRDADDLRTPGGAEDGDYAAAGLPFDAKDGPFAGTDELLQLPGMTRALYDRLRPFVTVHNPRRDVSLDTAPPEVLRALVHLPPAQIDLLLAARAGGDAFGGRGLLVVRITADAETADGGRFIREVVIRRSADPARAFDCLYWGRAWPSAGD